MQIGIFNEYFLYIKWSLLVEIVVTMQEKNDKLNGVHPSSNFETDYRHNFIHRFNRAILSYWENSNEYIMKLKQSCILYEANSFIRTLKYIMFFWDDGCQSCY